MAKTIALAEETIISKIYLIRGQKVMIDRDLAELYNVETKRLKEAVRRNISRFPPDFLFEMNKEEFEDWRTQNATSKEDKLGLRYAPFCFTEQGVTMLSCILNSERAILVNIQIIRVFTKIPHRQSPDPVSASGDREKGTNQFQSLTFLTTLLSGCAVPMASPSSRANVWPPGGGYGIGNPNKNFTSFPLSKK